MTTGEAIAAVFEVYAEHEGKPRWGDKTPLYMQHLPLLEGLFPDALWVHLVRDGRDAALSFLELPEGFSGKTWALPRTAAQFAARWRTEILRRGGSARTSAAATSSCATRISSPSPSASCAASASTRRCRGSRDARLRAARPTSAQMPEHKNLAQPPTPGLRDWRSQMSREDALAFEQVAGDVLRSAGYELLEPGASYPTRHGRRELARFAALSRSWNATAAAYQRSPLWRRSHPVLG